MPIDVITLYNENLGDHYAYLSDATVPVIWQLSLGAFLRPVVNFGLLLIMSFDIFENNATSSAALLKNLHAAVRRRIFARKILACLGHNSTRPA
jgi:hypothetical protein